MVLNKFLHTVTHFL